MCFAVLNKDIFGFIGHFITVLGAGIYCGSNSPERLETPFKGLICLESNNRFKLFIKVARGMRSYCGNNVAIHFKHSALFVFLRI